MLMLDRAASCIKGTKDEDRSNTSKIKPAACAKANAFRRRRPPHSVYYSSCAREVGSRQHEGENTEADLLVVKPVATPNPLDIVFHRRRQPRSVYYFSFGRKLDTNVLPQLEEENKKAFSLPVARPVGVPFACIRNAEVLKRNRDEKGLRAIDKQTRRTRQMKHLAERVYVPPTEDAGDIGQFIGDDQHFAVVKGRPIKDKFSLASYVDQVRETLRTKVVTGFFQDEVYLHDERLRNERKMITEQTELLKNYYTSFKEFESQDHGEFLAIRQRADEMALETEKKRSELKNLTKELSQVRVSLYTLEEKWRHCKMCQIFLFQISPAAWREEHPLKDKQYNCVESINNVFARYKSDAEGAVQSLEQWLEVFQEDVDEKEAPPELYFTDPWQIRLVFREMELQHLNSLLIIEKIKKPQDVMRQGIREVENYYDSEIASIEEQLEQSEKRIEQTEGQAKRLEQVVQDLVNTDLKELVASEATILNQVYVEHAYEQCVDAGYTGMTTLETLQALKLVYEDIMLKLDSLPHDVVKESEAVVQAKLDLALHKAHSARKQIAAVDNLTKNTKRALDKRFVRHGRPLMWRSKPPNPRPAAKAVKETYSDDELQHLTHFTDYCKYDDEEAAKLYFPSGT